MIGFICTTCGEQFAKQGALYSINEIIIMEVKAGDKSPR